MGKAASRQRFFRYYTKLLFQSAACRTSFVGDNPGVTLPAILNEGGII